MPIYIQVPAVKRLPVHFLLQGAFTQAACSWTESDFGPSVLKLQQPHPERPEEAGVRVALVPERRDFPGTLECLTTASYTSQI